MIESSTERDLPDIRALLERLQLPLAGVDEHLRSMLVAREGERTTAERSFPKFGFEPIDRGQVPPSVRASVEFRSGVRRQRSSCESSSDDCR